MTNDQKRIVELEKENSFLKAEVSSLKILIQQLLEEIERLKHPKNSRNSSVPPSKDENRPLKTKSLRKSSGKKPGGQNGHKGNNLKMTEHPDHIIEHKSAFCDHCGNDLSHAKTELIQRRQVVDIPPIIPQYTEHRAFRSVCSCGHVTESSFPVGINAPISYGPNIEATIAYLHTRQYIPFKRMSEYFRDVCNLPVSQGAIYDMLERFGQKALSTWQHIAEEVQGSKVVGSDETGAKLNGKRGWFWTWQTNKATFITFSGNRGTNTINTNFEKGFTDAVLVHDCWKSHFETKVKTHQICIAHLLRELTFCEDRYLSPWASQFKELLCDALKLKNDLSPPQYFYPIHQRTELERTLRVLLQTEIPKRMKEVVTFQKRMNKYKDYIFNFLYDPEVPPDNNASERAIRNIKVKQKISGQFKSRRGAEIYAMIRSITDTCIKNSHNVLPAFHAIAKSVPE